MYHYYERWLDSAASDLEEILDYLADTTQDINVVIKTEDSIKGSISNLINNPMMGVKITETKRKLILTDVPFYVIYDINNHDVRIINIVHNKRQFPPTNY